MPQGITNQNGLPVTIMNALSRSVHEVPEGALSATQLIKSTRQSVLELRNRFYSDVTDLTKVLIGNAVHDLLERSTSVGESETLYSAEIDGQVISGKPDLIVEGILYDYKTTGVTTHRFGPRESWIKQLNIYNWILRQNGIKILGSRIVWIFTDWSIPRYNASNNYPQASMLVTPIRLNPVLETEQYIKTRAAAYREALLLDSNDLPDCTPEERWERPGKFGVKKNDKAKRYKYFETIEEAEEYGEEKFKGPVISRIPPKQAKCDDYCPVSQWCNQYARLQREALDIRMQDINA